MDSLEQNSSVPDMNGAAQDTDTVGRSYKDMQQYVEGLHSQLNQLREEKDDLFSREKSLERENRALREEMEEAKSQLEEGKKTQKDLQKQIDEVLASQEKYKRLAENIDAVEEDMKRIEAERDELKSENEKLQAMSRDVRSSDIRIPADFQEMESLKEQLQKMTEENKKLEQSNDELMGWLKDSQQREKDLEKQLEEASSNPGTVSLLKTAFESGEKIDTRSMSDLLNELEEKEETIKELREELNKTKDESRTAVRITLPEQETDTSSEPSVYSEALEKIRQWYVQIESRLLLVCLPDTMSEFLIIKESLVIQRTHKMSFRYFAVVFALLVLMVNGLVSLPKVEKEMWPETVGMTGEKAKDIVQAECKGCNVVVINHFSAVTMDLRVDRVRIFVDENNVVKNPPRRG